MARRRKGRRVDGWLIVDKAKGVGSTDAVAIARRAFGAEKAGHAGTLDPLASGLLAIAFGEATKTIPVAQEGMKTYRFAVRLGAATSTDDEEGEVVATSPLRPSGEAVSAALGAFRGDILQTPPRFSAVRVNGARAYDLARAGEAVELAPRALRVERLELLDMPSPDLAEIEMVCGKGGYVRSIARDLGAALGCHGHVADLRRIASGGFDLAGAVTLDQFAAAPDHATCDALLLPLEAGLAGLVEARTDAAGAARLRSGQPAAILGPAPEYGAEAWASHQGAAVALGTVRAGALHPRKVFAAPPSPPAPAARPSPDAPPSGA